MAELFQKVIPYEYNYLCDSCGKGMMLFTGEMDGAKYVHKCAICSAKSSLSKTFPHVEYFPLGQEPEGQVSDLDRRN